MQLDALVSSSIPQKESLLVEGSGVLVWIHSPRQKLMALHAMGMYGGIQVFSSTNDVVYFFKALSLVPCAFLYKNVVLRYGASIYIMSSTLAVDKDLALHLQYETGVNYDVVSQDTTHSEVRVEGRLYLHTSLVENFPQQTGISVVNSPLEEWHECEVHRNATVSQGLLWNVVIKSAIPITGEKKSSLLWQSTLQNVEEFLRTKRMQVAKHNNSFLQLIFSSQEELHTFIFDYRNFITLHSQEVGEDSFTATTVIATLQKNTSMFSADIEKYYTFNSSEIIFNHCHT
ncbi:MAG: hypothetical protein K2M30_04445, partial [Desulfovibrionaceae bacterium]|nr:hypothetical protein [Desulfovibrionaceae bacterium]